MKLKKTVLTLFIIFTSFLILNCASVSKESKVQVKKSDKEIPLWFTDLQAVYPESEYLVQVEAGYTRDDALVNCATALAGYLNTNVKRIIEADTTKASSESGNVSQDQQIKTHFFAYTNLEMYAMEYTEPFFNKPEKKWYCAAYINREKAWNQFEPEVRDAKNSFYSVYNLSFETDDPLKKIRTYKQAQKQGQIFTEKLYTAMLFSKPLTEKTFAEDRKTLAAIDGLIHNEKERCIMTVSAPVDFSKTLASAVTQAFTQAGFKTSEKNAYYSVVAQLDYNKEMEDDLFVLYPSVKITVTGAENTVYIFQSDAGKIISYNEAKAQKNACSAVSEIVSEKLTEDFSKVMELK